MADKDVWIVFTKSRPLVGCGIHMDDSEFYYAIVCVPWQGEVLGASLAEIVDRVKARLLESKLALAGVAKCLRYVKQEWSEDTTSNNELHALAKEALDSGEVKVGCFLSEELEAECLYQHRMFLADE